MSLFTSLVLLLLGIIFPPSRSFAPRSHYCSTPLISSSIAAVKIDGYNEAFDIINECAVSGIPNDDTLYDAVRFIDKNAMKIYPTLEEKKQLWDNAHGSWKLQMATGGGKYTKFKSVPIFAFAMIDDNNFGNGIGLLNNNGENSIILLSLLGPHDFNTKRRQMVIYIDDVFLFGNKVTSNIPSFIGNGMGLGKKTAKEFNNGRPPAFTLIGCSDQALIARGGSGGIAIWTRMEKDIRPAAYKIISINNQ